MRLRTLPPDGVPSTSETQDVISYLVERAEHEPLPPRSGDVADAVGCELGEAVAVLRSLARTGFVRWAHGGWQLIARARSPMTV